MNFHRRMNLTVTILGSRNKNKHSEFWYLTSQRYLLYRFRHLTEPLFKQTPLDWKFILPKGDLNKRFLHQRVGSGSLYRKIISPNFFDRTTFDRTTFDRTTFDRKVSWPNAIWPKAIWPKVHLTESPFNRMPFDRKLILPKKAFGRKQNWSKGRLTESIWKMVFGKWSKIKFEKLVKWPKWHLTESSCDRKLFRKMVIWPNIVFFEKRSFDRKSFWQKVKQPWFIIWIGKAILIFESAFDQNRVWLPGCLRRRQAPCLRW
jgi:hypothetical protein